MAGYTVIREIDRSSAFVRKLMTGSARSARIDGAWDGCREEAKRVLECGIERAMVCCTQRGVTIPNTTSSYAFSEGTSLMEAMYQRFDFERAAFGLVDGFELGDDMECRGEEGLSLDHLLVSKEGPVVTLQRGADPVELPVCFSFSSEEVAGDTFLDVLVRVPRSWQQMTTQPSGDAMLQILAACEFLEHLPYGILHDQAVGQRVTEFMLLFGTHVEERAAAIDAYYREGSPAIETVIDTPFWRSLRSHENFIVDSMQSPTMIYTGFGTEE